MNFIKYKIKHLKFFAIVLPLLVLSCDKNFNSSVPYVDVNFTISLSVYNQMTIEGNSIVNPGAGYGGVIVFHSFDDLFYALDAACPCEVATSRVVVEVDESGVATCPQCGTKYNLWEGGSILSTTCSSAEPLKNYRVSQIYNGTSLLITN